MFLYCNCSIKRKWNKPFWKGWKISLGFYFILLYIILYHIVLCCIVLLYFTFILFSNTNSGGRTVFLTELRPLLAKRHVHRTCRRFRWRQCARLTRLQLSHNNNNNNEKKRNRSWRFWQRLPPVGTRTMPLWKWHRPALLCPPCWKPVCRRWWRRRIGLRERVDSAAASGLVGLTGSEPVVCLSLVWFPTVWAG